MLNIKEKSWKCPRCREENVIEFKHSIECLDCKLEFEKKDLKDMEDKMLILSIQEKLAIAKSLRD